MGALNDLEGFGQAVWLDFVDRKFLEAGGLQKLVDEGGFAMVDVSDDGDVAQEFDRHALCAGVLPDRLFRLGSRQL